MEKACLYGILGAIFILSIASCKKTASMGPAKGPDTSGKIGSTGPSGTTDVYIAGYDQSGSYNEAVYWKNGTKVVLANGEINAVATSIFVSGGDVYVAGTVGTNATYWKNGIQRYVSEGLDSSYASSIYVANNKLYIGVYQTGKYQKKITSAATNVFNADGSGQDLSNILEGSGIHPTVAATYVSGTDFYNAGNNTYLAGYQYGESVDLDYPVTGKMVRLSLFRFLTFWSKISLDTLMILLLLELLCQEQMYIQQVQRESPVRTNLGRIFIIQPTGKTAQATL